MRSDILHFVHGIALVAGLCACGTGAQGSGGTSLAHGGWSVQGVCPAGSAVESLRACLDGGAGPDACVAKVGVPLCDADGDGLGDDLEDALAVGYAPAFAFNGGAHGGDPERDWPASVEHFVARSKLIYRPDGAEEALVNPRPSLATLGQESFGGHDAANPAAGEGADFWLCLTDLSASSLVKSSDRMLALPDGVDLEVVAHPANGTLDASSHIFISFGLFFPYNEHSRVDDHQGDRESVEVFVNRATGAVDAAWFQRHDTQDKVQFIDVATYGEVDPSQEAPHGDVGSPGPGIHALRFFDHDAQRHHVVAYVSTGGHALYDYPANTRIFPVGPRDTHDGDGRKLLSWSGEVVPGWRSGGGPTVAVHLSNPGEESSITLPWARFRGQWGCANHIIAKSWPGPFGNERLPRSIFERRWGSPPAP